MKKRVVISLMAAVAILMWSTRGGEGLEPDSAGSTVEAKGVGGDAQPLSGESDVVGERMSVPRRDETSAGFDVPSEYRGHLTFTLDGVSKIEAKDAEILLAPAESVGVLEGAAGLVFRQFSFDGSGSARPDALHGERISVHQGSWSMAVPDRDLILVMTKVDGEPWSVVGPRLIPARATSGEFTLKSPEVCELQVVDSRGAPLSEVLVRATPTIPIGVPISMGSGMPVTNASLSARQNKNERRSPEPPANAADLGSHDSPVRFASREYDRDVWVGKPGFAWARCAWPASRRTGDLVLKRATELRVRLVGLEVSRDGYVLSLSQDGALVGFWSDIKRDGELMVRGAPVGPLRVLLRKRTAAGQVAILDSVFAVPPAAAYTLDVVVDSMPASGSGTLEILVHDPHDILGGGDILFACRMEDSIRGAANAAQHVWDRFAVAEQQRASRVLTLPGLPLGVYVVAIPRVGEVAVADLGEGGALAQVIMDLSQCISVAVEGRSGVDGRTHSLTWVRVGDGSIERSIAGEGFASRATWGDGAWHLAARPGRIDYELTRNVDGAGIEYGSLSIQPGTDRLALADDSPQRALVRVKVHRARVVDEVPLVTSVVESLRGPAGSTPAFVGADWSGIHAEYGQLEVRMWIRADARWEFIEEESALAFDERELTGLEPGSERLVEALVKEPK